MTTRFGWLLLARLFLWPLSAPARPSEVVRLTIDVSDGTIVKGTTKLQKLSVRASMGDLEIPIAKIASRYLD